MRFVSTNEDAVDPTSEEIHTLKVSNCNDCLMTIVFTTARLVLRT